MNRVPTEVVIVHMNEKPLAEYPELPCPLRPVTCRDEWHSLPLAAARNLAARTATTANLVFLDVDCIPAATYADELLSALQQTGGLVMGEVRYLPSSLPESWREEELQRIALPHPRRPQIPPGTVRSCAAYPLFWSLSFATTVSAFERIGGFDENFVGYGGEDTDFAFSARSADLPFSLSGARCYHQHHATYTPPYNHLNDIVTNARVFYRKWGVWPMEGWLDAFTASGHLRREETDLQILRLPSEEEIARHRSDAPFA